MTTPLLEPIQQGAQNDTQVDVLRRWLPPMYRNKPAWEALLAALASGDTLVSSNAYAAFDQLFMSSAVGAYLWQRASDYGIQYPAQIALEDAIFRQLAVNVTTQKLSHQALLKILEVFYGSESTRAHAISAVPVTPDWSAATTYDIGERIVYGGKIYASLQVANLNHAPTDIDWWTLQDYTIYDLTDGDTISFIIDDRYSVTVTFEAHEFGSINAALASEIAAIITRAFEKVGITAYASALEQEEGTAIAVYSGALGLLGSVQVTGGMAQKVLQFPTMVSTNTVGTWIGTKETPVKFTMEWQGMLIPDYITEIQIGDYVLFDFSDGSSIRGTYDIVDVQYTVDSVTFSVIPTTSFPSSITVTQTDPTDLIFFKKERQSVVDLLHPAFIAQHLSRGIDIVLPATTLAMKRSLEDAAYLHVQDSVTVEDCSRASFIATVNTAEEHNLEVGDTILIDGVVGEDVGQWGIQGAVLDVISPTSFTIKSVGEDGTGVGGTITKIAGIADTLNIGPINYDSTGFAITGIETVTTEVVGAERRIGTLQVDDTTAFPDSGYLVAGFGTEYETGPIPYIGKEDIHTFIVDYSFLFKKEIPLNANVTFLSQAQPFVPTNSDFGCHVINSSAGRVSAQEFIEGSSAAGVDINVNVVYPGDRGLGGEGLPVLGQQISDKVAVWAGDNVDQEEEVAHNG